jgi:hypothetical protein
MYTRIEKNREAEMRAGETLEDGVKVRVVAYQGGAVKGTGEYTVKSGELVSENGSGFALAEGTYDFVAYSYNSAISPDYSAAVVTVASPKDLLWGDKTENISAANNEVTITMKHKFAQVAVKAMMTGADIAVSDVSVSPGNSANLTVETGGLAKNASAVAAAVPVLTWKNLNTPTVTSDPVVIYTGANSVYVDLGTITIDGYDEPFTNARATFNKVLTEGYSYTLVISFKKTLWAKSNIYWKSTGENTGYLTFDTYENGHQGYQGVIFKWGSLVGISPAQVGGSNDFLDQDVPIYVPTYDSGTPSSSTWTPTTSNAKGWTTWGKDTKESTDIPYMDPVDYAGSYYERDNDYAMHPDRNTTEMYEEFRGDICRYLSTKTGVVEGDWRMPTADELGPASGWTHGGRTTTDNTLANAEGTADLLTASNDGAWAKNANMGDVVFPASGSRYGIYDGALASVGYYGYYWCGSARSVEYGWYVGVRSTYVYANDYCERSYAFSVRCVRN